MKARRLKGLSYLDFIIIFLVLFFLAGLFFRYSQREKKASSAELLRAEISFEVHGITKEHAEAIMSGGKLLFASGETLGELLQEESSVQKASVFVPSKNGRLIKTESLSLYDLFGKINLRGYLGEGGFFVNGDTYIAPNMTLFLKNTISEADFFIVNIEVF